MALRGEGGRIVSSLFIHHSFGHLLGNLGLLWVLAAGTEVAYGSARTALIYFAAGIGGNLLSAVTEDSSCLVVVGALLAGAAGQAGGSIHQIRRRMQSAPLLFCG
jgi:rhomboid protease GluP